MGDMDYSQGYEHNDYGSDADCYNDDTSYTYSPTYVTCKNCGAEGLHWTDYRGKWYLFNEKSQRHVCERRKQDAAEAFRHLF